MRGNSSCPARAGRDTQKAWNKRRSRYVLPLRCARSYEVDRQATCAAQGGRNEIGTSDRGADRGVGAAADQRMHIGGRRRCARFRHEPVRRRRRFRRRRWLLKHRGALAGRASCAGAAVTLLHCERRSVSACVRIDAFTSASVAPRTRRSPHRDLPTMSMRMPPLSNRMQITIAEHVRDARHPPRAIPAREPRRGPTSSRIYPPRAFHMKYLLKS